MMARSTRSGPWNQLPRAPRSSPAALPENQMPSPGKLKYLPFPLFALLAIAPILLAVGAI